MTFNHSVRRKADVEAALHVTTTRAIGPASWSWTSSRTVQFRPQTFWPAHTGVTVTADLRKVHAGPGLWGMHDTDAAFRIGRAFVMRVSNAKHRMTVTKDGDRIRTFGVSLGKPGFPTRSGIKVIMDTHVTYRMRSTTVGITGSRRTTSTCRTRCGSRAPGSSCTARPGTRTSASRTTRTAAPT